MSAPTLLVKGKLRGKAGRSHPNVVPIDYIIDWLKKRMPEFGADPPEAFSDRVLIVRSKTGSGKSTALPVHIFRLLRGEKTEARVRFKGPGVFCTQPRILTAQSLARDISASKHYPDMVLGETVGYQTGAINEKPGSGLIYATAGILREQLRMWPDEEIISNYRFIIIDEAHERSLDVDTLLMMLKSFLRRNLGNPKLPFVILASATLPVDKYANYFDVGDENVVEVTGRAYEVRDHYSKKGTNDYPADAGRLAVKIHRKNIDDDPHEADILIFMPGAAEIKEVELVLTKANEEFKQPKSKLPPFMIIAITGDEVKAQSPEYRRIKEPPEKLRCVDVEGKFVQPARRIIVSTVVAETGVTIETLKYVIDSGWSRTMENYYPGGIRGLITRPAPQSRIKQRKGRVGRLFPGEFYPLYTRNVYEALEKEQLPDIIVQGVDPIFLDVVAEASGAPSDAAPGGIFRVENIDMLDPPPVDSLASALEQSITSGFLRYVPLSDDASDDASAGHTLTFLGNIARRLNRLGLPQAQTIMAGYLWKVSIQDLALVVVLFSMDRIKLYDEEDKPAGAKALRAGVPEYLRTPVRGGAEDLPPTESEAYYYRSRLLISDDFLEALLAFEGFVTALEQTSGNFSRLLDWCDDNGINFSEARLLADMRDRAMNELISAGLNPFWGSEYRLSTIPEGEFLDTVIRLKHCIYAGLKHNTLTYDTRKNVYQTRLGDSVKVPAVYTDIALSRLRGLGADPTTMKPQKLVTNQVFLQREMGDRKDPRPPPLLYKMKAGLVSVLDGYVDVDEEYWKPRV